MTGPVSRPQILLTGLRLSELESMLGSRARALEVLRWLYHAPSHATAPAIRAQSWRTLQTLCELPSPQVTQKRVAEDETTRYLLSFGNGPQIETVRIPFEGRSTICVSSQAGCSRKCAFCATARIGFTRNLRAGEIVAQYLLAAREAPLQTPARNVVFMGMGEPMDNLDEVLRAVEILTQSPAPQLRAERVTVSTSGVLPGMLRFLHESRASLALSLNATTDAQRETLMPQTQRWPISALLEPLRQDSRTHPKRVHFIEYVLFAGLNDTDEDAERLVQLLAGIHARVNLIPHNPFEQSPFLPPSPERMLAFQQRVVQGGLRCLIRWPRGREIDAACGQLARRTAPTVDARPH